MLNNWASLAPTTSLELGIASIVAAFALLALGFAKSLLPVPSNPQRSDAPQRLTGRAFDYDGWC